MLNEAHLPKWSRPVPLKPAATRAARPLGTTTLFALATFTLLAACRSGDEAAPPEVRPVRATTIESRAVGDVVALTGRVQAQTEINQSFRIDGRLIERTVDVGDTVRPGQLLARLDPQNEESGLQAARAQLVAAQAQLVEARNNHQRMRDLVAENAVSRARVRPSRGAAADRRIAGRGGAGELALARKPPELHAAVCRRGRRGHRARAGTRRGGVGGPHGRPGRARRLA